MCVTLIVGDGDEARYDIIITPDGFISLIDIIYVVLF
jgi:hypothetical protein